MSRRRRPFTAWTLLKEGVTAFIDDNALTRGAAIAFYAVTAIAPVLFIATAIAALGLGQRAASRAVHDQLTRIMSSDSADLVQLAILHVRSGPHTLAGSLIGVIAAGRHRLGLLHRDRGRAECDLEGAAP